MILRVISHLLTFLPPLSCFLSFCPVLFFQHVKKLTSITSNLPHYPLFRFIVDCCTLYHPVTSFPTISFPSSHYTDLCRDMLIFRSYYTNLYRDRVLVGRRCEVESRSNRHCSQLVRYLDINMCLCVYICV